jgi:hypothetical protein
MSFLPVPSPPRFPAKEEGSMRSGELVIIVALDPMGRVLMKRDMELIRRILIEIQSRKDVKPREVTIEGVDDTIVFRHVELLAHAGYIEFIKSEPLNAPHGIIMIKELSWEGHDFVNALENDGVWNKIKQKLSAAELADLPLSVLKSVGVGLLKQSAMRAVGLSGD